MARPTRAPAIRKVRRRGPRVSPSDVSPFVLAFTRVLLVARLPVRDSPHLAIDDPEPVREPLLKHSRMQDEAILKCAEAVDPAGYFEIIAAEKDCRRICGLPPTYTVLEAFAPSRGKLLHYDQYAHPRGFESVSFASMAFYR